MATTTKTWSWATTLESWAFTQDATLYWTGALDTSVGNPADSLKANVSTADNSKTAIGYWSISGTWAAIFGIPIGATVTQVRIYGIDTRNVTRTNVTSNAFGDSQTPTNGLYCDALASGTELWAGRVPTAAEGTWTSTGAGSNAAVATAKQAATTTVAFRLYVRGQWGTANPVIQMNWDKLVIEITYSVSYMLAADAAAFSLTGQDVGLKVNRRVEVGAAALSLTGQDVVLAKRFTLAADAGSMALSGQDVGFRVNRRLEAGTGTFTAAGQDVGLEYLHRIVVGVGDFSLSGQAVALLHRRMLAADAAAFTLSGQAVALRYDRRLAAEPGAMAWAGQDVGLKMIHRLPAGEATFVLAGQVVTLTYSGGSGGGNRRRRALLVMGD